MVQYEVTGMSCNHCKITVETIFKTHNKQVTVDLSANLISVSNPLTLQEYESIGRELKEEGFVLGQPI